MTTVGTLIASYRKKRNLSQQDLADRLARDGYPTSNRAVSKWENDSNEPGVRVFLHLCRILDIPDLYEAYFGENPYNPLAGLNEAGKDKVYEYITLLKHCGDYRSISAVPAAKKNASRTRMIPLQLYPVSAGPGNFLDEENYEDIPVDESVPASADFAVRVSGDSMEPLFHKNQIVYIHRQETLENGETGIFFLDGEAYIKKLEKKEDSLRLISLNSAYAPIPVGESSQFRIFGKVVASA